MPLVNASRKPGEWQTYDIIFHPPTTGADGKPLPACSPSFTTGCLCRTTSRSTEMPQLPPNFREPLRGPLLLQDHGNPVRYRNISGSQIELSRNFWQPANRGLHGNSEILSRLTPAEESERFRSRSCSAGSSLRGSKRSRRCSSRASSRVPEYPGIPKVDPSVETRRAGFRTAHEFPRRFSKRSSTG